MDLVATDLKNTIKYEVLCREGEKVGVSLVLERAERGAKGIVDHERNLGGKS